MITRLSFVLVYISSDIGEIIYIAFTINSYLNNWFSATFSVRVIMIKHRFSGKYSYHKVIGWKNSGIKENLKAFQIFHPSIYLRKIHHTFNMTIQLYMLI